MTARCPNFLLSLAALFGLASSAPACVKAPDIVLTDQKTAFERQAAGEFRALENDVHRASIAPKGEDITREAIEANNPESGDSTLGEAAQLYSAVQTDADWIDRMLVAGCLGEARDALLTARSESCEREPDSARLTRVVERANLHRRQLWQAMQKRDPQAKSDVIRANWREVHLQRVICGASIEESGGTWGKKEC